MGVNYYLFDLIGYFVGFPQSLTRFFTLVRLLQSLYSVFFLEMRGHAYRILDKDTLPRARVL